MIDLRSRPPPTRSLRDTDDPPEKKHKYRVRGVEVTILNERVQYYDKDEAITESVTDYPRRTFSVSMRTLDSFLRAWNPRRRNRPLLMNSRSRGVLGWKLREGIGQLRT